MSDIEDIMRHLNLRESPVSTQPATNQPIVEQQVIEDIPGEDIPVQETSISDDEFNALIGDFSEPEDVVAASMDEYDRIAEEEMRESEGEDNTENEDSIHFHMPDGSQVDVPVLTEVRDLDAEEDADWERAIAEGRITAIPRSLADANPSPNEIIAIDDTTGEVRVLHRTIPTESYEDPIDPTADDPDEEDGQQESFLIAENSPTLQVDETTARFSGAQWYDKIRNKRIIIAGIGGIGSNAAYQIARLHPARLMLYDSDVVDAVNMAGQLYCNGDIGNSKVSALDRMIRNYTTLGEIYTVMDNFTDTSPAGDIMICGFDNMEARKTFFESWMRHVELVPDAHKRMCLLIDGRLDMSNLQVFCLTGDDTYNINRYKDEFLFSDAEADQTICSMKQTTYLACMIGSIITNLLVNFTANLTDPVLPYDLPFLTEYDAQNIIFKTTN